MTDKEPSDVSLFDLVRERRTEHKNFSAERSEQTQSKCRSIIATMDLGGLKNYRDELQRQLRSLRKNIWECRWDLTVLCAKQDFISKEDWDERFALVNKKLDEALDDREEIKIILPVVFREIRTRADQGKKENRSDSILESSAKSDNEISLKKGVEIYLNTVKRDRIIAPSPLVLETSSGIPQDYWKAITKDVAFLVALEKKVRLRATSFKFAKREETREFWAKVLQDVLTKIDQRRYHGDSMSYSGVSTGKRMKIEDKPLVSGKVIKTDPFSDLDDSIKEMTQSRVIGKKTPGKDQ